MAGCAAAVAVLLALSLFLHGASAQAVQPGDPCTDNSDCMNSDPAPSPPLCCSTLTSPDGEAVCVRKMFNAQGQQQCLCPAFEFEAANAYGCNSTAGATTKQYCCRGADPEDPSVYGASSGLCVSAPELCTCYTTASDCPKGPKKTCCAKSEDQQDDSSPGVCSTVTNRPDGTFCTCKSAAANTVPCGTATAAFNSLNSPDRCCKGDRCPTGGAGCTCRTVDDCRDTTADCCTFNPITGTGLCATSAYTGGTAAAGGGKQQCLDCNLFSGATKQKCAAGTTCCPNGQCKPPSKCGCVTDSDCADSQCCRSDTRTCTSVTVNATTGAQLCGDCNTFADRNLACPAGASVCCKRGNCAADASKCACRYTLSDCSPGYVCNRDKASADLGTCTASLFNGTKQVGGDCNEAAANGVSCPGTKPVCCKVGGACVTSVIKCPKALLCGWRRDFASGDVTYAGGCPWGQCCAWNNTCVKSAQACPNCNNANGAPCPLATPVCCPRGACVKTAAQCEAVTINGFNVAKYQRFHREVVDLIANSTLAGDNRVFSDGAYNRGEYPRPDFDDYADFRAYVEPGVQRIYCADRYNGNWDAPRTDPAQIVHQPDGVTNLDPTGSQAPFEGLDATSAPAVIQALAAAAAEAWRDECAAYPKCAAAMAQDGATLQTFQAFTNATAAKILAYLKQAPGNRNLLCGPRDYFGPVYSAFVRAPDSWDQYFGAVAWPWYLRPLTVPVARADGVNETLSVSTLLQSSIEARWYLPEQVLSFEGIISLLILHDHTLIPAPGVVLLGAAKAATLSSPSPTLTTATKAKTAAKAKAGAGARHRHRVAAGPTASDAYRKAGFVAGVKRVARGAAASAAGAAAAAPAAAKAASAGGSAAAASAAAATAAAAAAAAADGSAAVSTSAALATCAATDAACIVSVMRAATASPSSSSAAGAVAGGGGSGGGATSALAAAALAGVRSVSYSSSSQQECLTSLRDQLENLKAAQGLCTTVKRDADAALKDSPGAQPKTLLQLQVKRVAATLQLVCPGLAKYPDPATYRRLPCSKALKIFSDRLSAVAAAVAPVACGANAPATSASAGNVFAATAAAWSLVRNPAGLRATSCLDVGASLLADAGCALLQPLIDKYTAAFPCCQNVCAGNAACVALAEGWVSNAYVGECAVGAGTLAWPPGFTKPSGAPWGA